LKRFIVLLFTSDQKASSILQGAICLTHATLKNPQNLQRIPCGNLFPTCSLQTVYEKAICLPFERIVCGICNSYATPIVFCNTAGRSLFDLKQKTTGLK